MAEPATERLFKCSQVTFCNEDITRCSGPAVQVFVAATDGKVSVYPIKVYLDGTATVAQVPDHQCTLFMSTPGNGCHVMQSAGFVVNVG